MTDDPDQEWSIGELAVSVGLSVRALRHYDDEGLLPPSWRTVSGHRRYDAEAVRRLYRIVALRELGFSLADIGDLLDGPDDADALRVTAARHLAEVEQQLTKTIALRDRLRRLATPIDPSDEPTTTHDALEAIAMTIDLDRITTRTGDRGRTNLASGPRVSKAHVRIEVLGALDELNSRIGLALAQDGVPDHHRPVLDHVQQRLFDLGADLAHHDRAADAARVGSDEVVWIEEVTTPLVEAQAPLTSFVIPGGHPYVAHLHSCRTGCRLAERRTVALQDADEDTDPADPSSEDVAVRYLNRLSDLFFVLARDAAENDPTWTPLPR